MAGLPSRLQCEDGQIACSDGSGCFAEADLCDNFQDCADNSDEENCPSITCSDDEFLCEDDDICFPLSYRCDGQEDCFDGSDEQSCKLRQRFVRELLILNTGMWLGQEVAGSVSTVGNLGLSTQLLPPVPSSVDWKRN